MVWLAAIQVIVGGLTVGFVILTFKEQQKELSEVRRANALTLRAYLEVRIGNVSVRYDERAGTVEMIVDMNVVNHGASPAESVGLLKFTQASLAFFGEGARDMLFNNDASKRVRDPLKDSYINPKKDFNVSYPETLHLVDRGEGPPFPEQYLDGWMFRLILGAEFAYQDVSTTKEEKRIISFNAFQGGGLTTYTAATARSVPCDVYVRSDKIRQLA